MAELAGCLVAAWVSFSRDISQDEQRPDFSVDPLINNLTECTLDRARTKDVQPMKISLPQINNFYRRRKPVTFEIDWLTKAFRTAASARIVRH